MTCVIELLNKQPEIGLVLCSTIFFVHCWSIKVQFTLLTKIKLNAHSCDELSLWHSFPSSSYTPSYALKWRDNNVNFLKFFKQKIQMTEILWLLFVCLDIEKEFEENERRLMELSSELVTLNCEMQVHLQVRKDDFIASKYEKR